MKVPEHIHLVEGAKQMKANETKPVMVVPNRITVGGENEAQPVEVLTNRLDYYAAIDKSAINGIPQILTANELPVEDLVEQNASNSQNLEYSTISSIAVEEDPLRELKNVRRQVTRLTVRISELEKENKRKEAKEKKLIIANCLAFIALFAFILKYKQ